MVFIAWESYEITLFPMERVLPWMNLQKIQVLPFCYNYWQFYNCQSTRKKKKKTSQTCWASNWNQERNRQCAHCFLWSFGLKLSNVNDGTRVHIKGIAKKGVGWYKVLVSPQNTKICQFSYLTIEARLVNHPQPFQDVLAPCRQGL